MSDMENVDIMLGSSSRKEAESQPKDNEENADLRFNGVQNQVNPTSEDFRTLLNTDKRDITEIIAEAVRMINVRLPVWSQVNLMRLVLRNKSCRLFRILFVDKKWVQRSKWT